MCQFNAQFHSTRLVIVNLYIGFSMLTWVLTWTCMHLTLGHQNPTLQRLIWDVHYKKQSHNRSKKRLVLIGFLPVSFGRVSRNWFWTNIFRFDFDHRWPCLTLGIHKQISYLWALLTWWTHNSEVSLPRMLPRVWNPHTCQSHDIIYFFST